MLQGLFIIMIRGIEMERESSRLKIFWERIRGSGRC
jgi:hypothetical protein